MAAVAVADRGQQDPLVDVRRRRRRGEAAEEGQEPGRPADLRLAGGAALDVGREASGVDGGELVRQVRVDQATRVGVVESSVTGRRVAHNLYMAGTVRKVAAGTGGRVAG